MANESTYTGISTLVANIYELALMTAQEGNIVAPFVKSFPMQNGSQPRVWGNYSGGTFASVAESADMSAQAFNAAAAGTATPAVYGQQFFLTNRRIKTDPANAQGDAGQYLGETASAHIDTNLVSLFSSLTGGTVGTAGGTITWANVFRAQAYLRTNKVPAPYFCVLHPVQWYYLISATSGVPTLMQNTRIAESLIAQFYMGSFGGMNFLSDANITSGTAAMGAMWGRDAMFIDTRQGFQIEPQYDASRSGNGGWELNASMEYAYGLYRPTYGVTMTGTSN
jgi:hypothetical protein